MFSDEGSVLDNRYSLPTAPELVALIVGDMTVYISRFDVICSEDSTPGPLEQVPPLNPYGQSWLFNIHFYSCIVLWSFMLV